MLKRTHNCGQLRKEQVGQKVVLAGWVNGYRDHGGVIFIDLRDREGLTQIVFHPENAEAHQQADRMRNEWVVAVSGTVVAREAGMANPRLPTGDIELDCTGVEVLNPAMTPPFMPDEAAKVGEERRLEYRFIDLRQPRMQQILRTRHRTTKVLRDYFDGHGFSEIETPFLCRSTPEGARDFLVPSRLQKGSFYALPQSPQLFKQILMTTGADRYLQIVRCFRDEDPRADRQAEFTQVDLEMAFVERDDVIQIAEGAIRAVWKEVLGVEIGPIQHMGYGEAMDRYGSDRPDLRFGMELVNVSDIVKNTEFNVFKGAIEKGGLVKAICVPGGARMTRKQTDELAEWVKQFGAGGLPLVKVEGGKVTTGVAKFVEPVAAALIERMGAKDGDLICFGVSEKSKIVHRVLGELRVRLAHDLGMIKPGEWKWLWVVDFPLVEYSEEDKRYYATHHPFTAPKPEHLDMLESNPAAVLSDAYDLVLNGSELGGGSIRIHRSDVQSRVFRMLGINDEEAKMKFGFLLNALSYGAPPHGGLAFGLDRLVMHLVGTTNIRDVIAFPKTQNGADLMTEAPAPVDEMQLKELNIRVQAHQSPMKAV
ncbi:MAG: aspartate--tRNA ligase [Phycisphaeraceae bacterium]